MGESRNEKLIPIEMRVVRAEYQKMGASILPAVASSVKLTKGIRNVS